jgi:hypothetical protein
MPQSAVAAGNTTAAISRPCSFTATWRTSDGGGTEVLLESGASPNLLDCIERRAQVLGDLVHDHVGIGQGVGIKQALVLKRSSEHLSRVTRSS